MKFWERVGIVIMSLWGLFAVHQLVSGLFKAHHWKGMSAGDWGTWIGSIGTVGALIGTIWLATAQARRKRTDDLTLARLHAASMVLRLHHAETTISDVCQDLLKAVDRPFEPTLAQLKEISAKLSAISLWGIDDLVPLVPLPGNAAAKLARAADSLDSVGRGLSRTIADYYVMFEEEIRNFAKFLYVMLASALEYIEEAGRICSSEAGALEQQAR